MSSVKRQLVPYNTNSASSSSEDEITDKTKKTANVQSPKPPPQSQPFIGPKLPEKTKTNTTPKVIQDSQSKSASSTEAVNSNLKWTVYQPTVDTSASTSSTSVNSTRAWTVLEPNCDSQKLQKTTNKVAKDSSVHNSDHSYAHPHANPQEDSSSRVPGNSTAVTLVKRSI